MEKPIPYNELMDALDRIIERARYKSKFAATREVRKKNQATLEFHESIKHFLDIRYAKGKLQGDT